MPRIAWLCEFPSICGGEAMMLELMDKLPWTPRETLVVCPGGGDLQQALVSRGLPQLSVDWKLLGASASDRAARIGELLAGEQVDLVHANSLSMSVVSGLLSASHHWPCVAHARDIMGLSARRAQAISQNRLVMAVSRAVADHLESSGVDPARLVVAPDGIDCRRLSPQRVRPGVLRRELGVDDATPLVLCVGQVGPRKGQDIFMAAAEVVAGREPRAQFVVVGTRLSEKPEVVEFEAALHDRARRGILSGRSHFLGWRTDVPELLRDADVVVNAARQEPLGVVILEAMSLARPLVATAVGGTEEQLEHERSALLVASDQPLALAEAVLRLLGDSTLRKALGRAARQTIEQRFDVEQAAARVERLQRQSLNEC